MSYLALETIQSNCGVSAANHTLLQIDDEYYAILENNINFSSFHKLIVTVSWN